MSSSSSRFRGTPLSARCYCHWFSKVSHPYFVSLSSSFQQSSRHGLRELWLQHGWPPQTALFGWWISSPTVADWKRINTPPPTQPPSSPSLSPLRLVFQLLLIIIVIIMIILTFCRCATLSFIYIFNFSCSLILDIDEMTLLFVFNKITREILLC